MDIICRPVWILTFLSLLTHNVCSEEILGCGGFVKSDIDINFSQVDVKLYTKQGSLKDQTDCAPNNGYYFLPLYDKGEYVLKIEPPVGWSFEPKEVTLNVDGSTDHCSQGKDINFIFKGFAIIGKVVSAGSKTGPKGVKVLLLPEVKRDGLPVHETFTTEDGSFQFTPVPPGRYVVQASHPRWQLVRNSVPVQLVSGNADVGDSSLVVAGYDVSGSVTSDDEPIKGVSFVLFQADGAPPISGVQGCDKTPLSGFRAGGTPLCHVNSDEKGKFLFPSLPPGRYRVVPHYEGPQSIKFDVRPVELDFTVAHDSVQIGTQFQVKGFSVSGRVLLRPGGKGIAGATILLDGSVTSQTRGDGSYHLENMQAGAYILKVQANDIKFADIPVKVTPNTPQLADIFPSAFKVCGSVAPHQLTPGATETSPRQVQLSRVGSSGQPIVVVIKGGNGEFCQFLEPGKYEATVRVTEDEQSRGLKFTPTVQAIQVTDSPILSGIVFLQLKVDLSGQLQCLAANNDCGDIPIVLNTIPSDSPESRVQAGVVVSRGGRYTFVDLLPGKYQVSVDKDDWCWESTSHTVLVNSAKSTVPAFRQTGFSVTIISSHDTQVDYRLLTGTEAPSVKHTLHLKQGTTKSCVSTPGSYEFIPVGCHGYPQPSIKCSLSTAPAVPIRLAAISHTVGGRIVSQEKVSDVYINVLGNDDTLKTKLGPLKPEAAAGGRLYYKFELLVTEGEILTFMPTAGILLFNPSKSTIVGPGDCTEIAVEFFAEKGHLIEGQVLPLLAGVKITVASKGSEDVVVESETAADGKFKFGPLPGDIEYRVAAEKEGYVLTGPDAKGNFNAHKLAEVIVEVLDKADGRPLQGVLLSLSGGESFRRNSQTGPDGKRAFSSLSPSEYYLRPMMKEYRFEPSSKMITVVEGATVNVQLQGHQVAFSAYGFVTSLSGEPEEGVVVEAVGIKNCSQYQEESSTETSGMFRIRGLQPQCEYTVRVKHGPLVNHHIQRSTPDGIVVKAGEGDISDLRLIVFHPLTQMDLTAHIQTTVPEHLRTLRAKLCREDAPDSPVHVIKLDPNQGKSTSRGSNTAMILFPSIPVDGRGYFVQLESTLSRSTHSYTTHAVHFRANGSFKHIKLTFKPDPKVTEQDLGHSSYMALPLIVIGLLAYLNQQKLLPVLNRVAQSLNGSVTATVNNGRANPTTADHNVADAVMVEPVINVRSRKVKPRKT